MKISKEQIMEVVNKPKTICWSDVLIGLNLLPLFKKYKEEKGQQYDIMKVLMGKTLMDEIDNILKERILKTKDRRVSGYKKSYRPNIYAWDCLQSQPATAKEDIDYMELKDL